MFQSIHGFHNLKFVITDLCDYLYCRYDANAKGHSHRLYKETITSESGPNPKVNGCYSLPSINFQWETLASNLEEFLNVAVRSSQLCLLSLPLFTWILNLN